MRNKNNNVPSKHLINNVEIKTQAFINGQYQNAALNTTFPCISPIDGRHLGDIASCSNEDVDIAVAGALKAFESGVWSTASLNHRKDVLFALADEIDKHKQELATLETLNIGKPISECLHTDIGGSALAIRWFAECADKLNGQLSPSNEGIGMISREPIGVVGAITPWNFPLYMAIWKLGPALAMGNSVVLKPSEKSPLTALYLADLLKRAGVPDGVVQVLPGFGDTAGRAIAMHNDIHCLSFTGCHLTGQKLLQYAGQSNAKRVWTEAGGKTPFIVFDDVKDIEQAAQIASAAIFYNQGQVCFAGSRLLVHESIHDEFVEKVIDYADIWYPGYPLDPSTMAGAIVDDIQLQKVLSYIDKGKQEGATLRAGGERVMTNTGGYYVAPTVFTDVTNDMVIAQEEIFGPVLSVIKFSDEEEAIQIANDTIYGLASSVWTGGLDRAHRVSKQLRAGSVWVNCFHGGDMTMPFGGYKQSGNARDKSLMAFDKYSEVKATWINVQ